MHQRRWALISVAAIAAACGTSIPSTERAKVVRVIYDPAAADLPTPNDLAMRDGRVAIDARPELSDAENELKLSFNGADGFSVGSSARVQFSGPLSAASISERTVLALDLGERGAGAPTPVSVRRDYSECDRSISLVSPAGFERGHVYLFAVRGGEGGLEGAGGEQVVPAPAFHFLRAGRDLREHPDALPGATRAEKERSAVALEEVRRKLEPYFQLLETQGLPRRDVAALWSFTALTSGEVLFDPGSRRIPFPNDLLRDPDSGLVQLPIDPAEAPESQALKHAFNRLDGFSMTAALWFETSQAVDRASLAPGRVRLFRRDVVEEVADLEVTLSDDGRKVTVQPRTPLRSGTPYVVVVSGLRDVEGKPLRAMPLASLLRLRSPLLDSAGESAVSSLCKATAARLEPLRSGIDGVLSKLEREGLRREEALAYTFTTQDAVERVRSLWRAPYEAKLLLTVSGVQRTDPPITMPSVETIVTGKMTTLDFVEPTTRELREVGVPREIEFVLTVPEGLPAGGAAPVVVFGHGLNTERRLGLALANRLARSGFAMMAIDLPLHGERSLCLRDTQCSLGATCAADGTCTRNGQPADLARLPNIYPVGLGQPIATGAAWIDLQNMVAARDHFRQAYVDLSAQVRLIREMDWRPVTGGHGLDGERLSYVGLSLGSLIGGVFAGFEPNVESVLLNVGGAGLFDLMRESTTFGPPMRLALSVKGIQEGTPEYESFANAMRWLLDEVDPLNLARHVSLEPLARPKRLRLQMALGDPIVPNSATERLVKATGADRGTQLRSFIGTHGFLADPAEPACYVGQDDLADFLEGK